MAPAVRARTSFTGHVPELGHAPVVTEGAVLAGDDPIVVRFPDLFEAVDAHLERVAEPDSAKTTKPIPVPKSKGKARGAAKKTAKS